MTQLLVERAVDAPAHNTVGQGNMEVTSSTSLSDSITCMVRVALEENKDADPEKSALA